MNQCNKNWSHGLFNLLEYFSENSEPHLVVLGFWQ